MIFSDKTFSFGGKSQGNKSRNKTQTDENFSIEYKDEEEYQCLPIVIGLLKKTFKILMRYVKELEFIMAKTFESRVKKEKGSKHTEGCTPNNINEQKNYEDFYETIISLSQEANPIIYFPLTEMINMLDNCKKLYLVQQLIGRLSDIKKLYLESRLMIMRAHYHQYIQLRMYRLRVFENDTLSSLELQHEIKSAVDFLQKTLNLKKNALSFTEFSETTFEKLLPQITSDSEFYKLLEILLPMDNNGQAVNSIEDDSMKPDKPTFRLNVILADDFRNALRTTQTNQIELAYTRFYPNNCRLFIDIPVNKHGFISRQDAKSHLVRDND